MTGLIVVCCTLASMRRTTWPPRWIRPRMGGLSLSGVPRPGAAANRRPPPPRPPSRPPPAGRRARPAPPSGGGGRAAPFGDRRRLALVPGHDVDLVDLHLALEPHRRGLG